MFKCAEPFFIKVITPLHAGSGDDLGIVDLPIQRERHTSFPKIEASSLKGAMREAFEVRVNKDEESEDQYVDEKDQAIEKIKRKLPLLESAKDYCNAISLSFGPKGSGDHAGALGFTDARLLFFPVKSVQGVFAYITCPAVLKRFQDDLKMCGEGQQINSGLLTVEQGKAGIPSNESKVVVNEDKVLLEEYCFDVIQKDLTKIIILLDKYKLKDEIKERLVILSDNDFKDFVNLSTEVITRIKINPETGTVQDGALWTEEYLPCESVLYSLALTTPIFKKEKGIFTSDKEEEEVMEFFKEGVPKVMQIGGNATIGKGIVKILKGE